MTIFLNIFIKTMAIFFSFFIIILIIALLLNLIDDQNSKFTLIYGEENSSNTIAIIELNGLIIEKNRDLVSLTSPFIISPTNIKTQLEDLEEIAPKIIIFSINSPGGTVSASKALYDVISDYKKNNNVKILFHTNELLASGGYWVSTAADEIYASYGSIIGSIGVKGPDWFYYDQPKTISSGIFGNLVETKNGIKVYSNKAGISKDIFNPFRKPTTNELDHLQSMVDEIYDDFVRIVSKERKIEVSTIVNEIGALIYTSKNALDIHLINDQINLDSLIQNIIRESEFKNYKVIKVINNKNSLLREIITSNLNIKEKDLAKECLSLRSSISVILSYEAIGC